MGLFNERLKELKDEKDIMLKDLATELGIANSKLSYYLNGNSEPPYELLVKIANFFSVTTDYLTGMSEYRRFEDIALANSISKKSNATEPTKNQRNTDINKNCIMLHNLLLKLSLIQVEDETFDDIWEMVKIWLDGLEKYITFSESCLNDQFTLDSGRIAMDDFLKARFLASRRISTYLSQILEDDSIDKSIKGLILKRTSYSIKTPKREEEDSTDVNGSSDPEALVN